MFLELLSVGHSLTFGAVSAAVCSMRLVHLLLSEASLRLKVVNILRQIMRHHILVEKHFAEVVRLGCVVLAQVQERLSQLVERLRFLVEEVELEDGFRERQLIFFEVVVKACAGRPEVGNTRAHTDAGASHKYNLLELSFFETVKEDFLGEARPALPLLGELVFLPLHLGYQLE